MYSLFQEPNKIYAAVATCGKLLVIVYLYLSWNFPESNAWRAIVLLISWPMLSIRYQTLEEQNLMGMKKEFPGEGINFACFKWYIINMKHLICLTNAQKDPASWWRCGDQPGVEVPQTGMAPVNYICNTISITLFCLKHQSNCFAAGNEEC